ncbi:MAG: hypothetical protein AB7O04_06285 [Hyphomonadaceae bacterium]
MPQTAKVSASITLTKTATPDGGSAKVEQALSMLKSIASGVGSGQADLGFIDLARTLASNTSEDFDLAGSLVDALGATVTCVEIVALMIQASAANTTNLTIGGASDEWQGPFAAAGDKIVLRPGEAVLFFSDTGWAVGAGASDDLLIANAAGATAAFDIGFIGRSA